MLPHRHPGERQTATSSSQKLTRRGLPGGHPQPHAGRRRSRPVRSRNVRFHPARPRSAAPRMPRSGPTRRTVSSTSRPSAARTDALPPPRGVARPAGGDGSRTARGARARRVMLRANGARPPQRRAGLGSGAVRRGAPLTCGRPRSDPGTQQSREAPPPPRRRRRHAELPPQRRRRPRRVVMTSRVSASRAHTSPAAAPSRAARLRSPGTAPLPRYPPSCAVPSRGNGEHVAEAAPRVQSRASAALVPAARPRHRAALGLRRSAARTWRCWALRVRCSRPGARLRSAAGTSAGLRFHLKQTPPPRIPRAVPEPPGDF